MKEINQTHSLVTHVVVVRFWDQHLGQDRRVSLYTYGSDAARSLALTLTAGPFHFVSTTIPYVDSLQAYSVRAVEWAPL